MINLTSLGNIKHKKCFLDNEKVQKQFLDKYWRKVQKQFLGKYWRKVQKQFLSKYRRKVLSEKIYWIHCWEIGRSEREKEVVALLQWCRSTITRWLIMKIDGISSKLIHHPALGAPDLSCLCSPRGTMQLAGQWSSSGQAPLSIPEHFRCHRRKREERISLQKGIRNITVWRLQNWWKPGCLPKRLFHERSFSACPKLCCGICARKFGIQIWENQEFLNFSEKIWRPRMSQSENWPSWTPWKTEVCCCENWDSWDRCCSHFW